MTRRTTLVKFKYADSKRRAQAKQRKGQQTCVKHGCNNAQLKKLKRGQTIQTRNGSFIGRLPVVLICPCCGANY